MCSFMLICQCCFAIVKVLLNKVTTTTTTTTTIVALCRATNKLLKQVTINYILENLLNWSVIAWQLDH